MEETHKPKITALHVNCTVVERELDSYLEGSLDSSIVKAFDRHVECCEDCAGLVQDVKDITAIAATLADDPVPTTVSQRLRAHLTAELGVRFRIKKPSLSLVK